MSSSTIWGEVAFVWMQLWSANGGCPWISLFFQFYAFLGFVFRRLLHTDEEAKSSETWCTRFYILPYMKMKNDHMKKLVEIWLQLHWFVHYEIVYFLLYYILYSHIFSLIVRISDSRLPSERATIGGQSDTNWNSVHKKSTRHFDNKETQSFAIWNIWQFSIMSCDMFGLFWNSFSPILSDSNKP